jgi:hypothetical protein
MHIFPLLIFPLTQYRFLCRIGYYILLGRASFLLLISDPGRYHVPKVVHLDFFDCLRVRSVQGGLHLGLVTHLHVH